MSTRASVEFSLDCMGFSARRTGLRGLEGSLEFDLARPTSTSVNAPIPAASVDERLMSRLMDADLLGRQDHPATTFKSTRVEVVDLRHSKVTGDCAIHGVSRPALPDTHSPGQAVHPFAKTIPAGYRAQPAVDRCDFGVAGNAAMDPGGAYLGERVPFSLSRLARLQ